jgi:hypothetical protein
MGTFHEGLGELHGLTVVVDTHGPRIAVGRCHTVTGSRVVLHDADLHDEREAGVSKQAYLARAAEVGAWPRHRQLVLDLSEVASIRRLGEIAAG